MKRILVMIAGVALAASCAGCGATSGRPAGPSTNEATRTPGATSTVETTAGPAVPLAKMVTGVAYKAGKHLSVVSPAAQGPWPVVVILGGYEVDPEVYYDLARAIAQRGAVVFVPEWDYTLPSASDRRSATVTRGLDDIADAMRFVRVNSSVYRGDPARVVLVGHSLGGTFAMTTTLAGDRFGTQATSHDASALPDACVSLDGVVPFREVLWRQDFRDLYAHDPATWDKINPEHYMDASAVRPGVEFRFFVAENDLGECRAMVGRMTALGITASVSRLDVTHMEMAYPQDETVAAIVGLARKRP